MTPTDTQRRLWNRGPLLDLFPRLPSPKLESLLDLTLSKNAIYNLSESKHWNSIRLTSLTVAHCRHTCTDYDALLREGVERYEARKRTAQAVWKCLRAWCPWDESNPVLERCWRVSVLRPEEREPGWDPMDLDESEDEREVDEGGRGRVNRWIWTEYLAGFVVFWEFSRGMI
ncbi:hypothetical protein Q7P37_001094 [Cladosporium fusiforme]